MFSTIRTNINALRANMYLNQTGTELTKSLARLSSGRRINSAADDAAGMFIADGLRSETSAMNQGVRNANDAIGVINIIDKAIDEQIKLLDSMKQKAITSAQDSQSDQTRTALQAEVLSLVDRLDNIAYGTRYNGKSLLTGSFSNQEFQVGSKSHDSVIASIGPTVSQKLGNTFFATGAIVTASSVANLKFLGLSGGRADATIAPVIISTSAGTGLGAMAKAINAHSDELGGVRASYSVIISGRNAVTAGTLSDFTINGINLGSINVQQGDANGSLIHAINSTTSDTGVEASVDIAGKITLRSVDGRGISITNNNSAITGITTNAGAAATDIASFGRLTLTRQGANDIIVSADPNAGGLSAVGLHSRSVAGISLSGLRSELTSTQADAAGLFANFEIMSAAKSVGRPGVLTLKGSMAVMDIIDTALIHLNRIRASTGAASRALSVTKTYLQSSIVETKAAESQIRDVDFATESSNFQKNSILAQSGNYALSQANSLANLVTKLFN